MANYTTELEALNAIADDIKVIKKAIKQYMGVTTDNTKYVKEND